MTMVTRDIGIVGVGLWDAEPVTNEHFGARETNAPVRDPYKGRKADDGSIQIAGLTLTPASHPRTIAAVAHAFADPHRGTRKRRFFPRDLKVSEAETEAARRAIPKNAAIICHNLGINQALAFEVDSICNSSISQLITGSSLILSGFAKHVLCVQSVAYSRVTDPTSSSSVQEADMASAFVIGPSPGTRMAFGWRTDGSLHSAIKLHWAPPGGAKPRRWWESAPEGLYIHFDPELQAALMAQIAENAGIVCGEALGRAEMKRDELDVFITHQATYWQSSFIEDTLGLEQGVGFETFGEYANINSAGIPASIAHARRRGKIAAGSKVLLFGPAAGYTYAAAAIQW